MDVSKGGKILPDTSARPVLVTHRPMIQDPMVKPVEDSDETVKKNENQKLSVPAHASKIIQPVSENEEAKSENSDTEPEVVGQPADTSDAEAVVEAVVEQAGSKSKSKEGGTDKEDKAREEHVQKLIADKTYFVPIGEAAQQRNNRAVLILMALLIVIAGSYLALDAQLVKNSVPLPFEFFKEPSQATQSPITQPQPVVTKPVSATKKYASNIDSLTFIYPLTWKVGKDPDTNSIEYLLLEPTQPVDKLKTIQTQYNRLGPTAGVTNIPNRTIAKIDYFDLHGTSSQKLYVRQVIYNDENNRFGIAISVTDQKSTEKVGDLVKDFDTPFLAADGKTKLVMSGLITISENSKAGFAKIESAQDYIAHNKDFINAKNILMSLKIK